jgi:HSP20 family protein
MSFGRYYNPFYDFFDTFTDFDDFFPHPHRAIEGSGGDKGKKDNRQVARPNAGGGQLRRGNNWFNMSPQIDLYDKPDRYEVVASVPGTSIENLHIDFDPDTRVLTISGEDSDSASGGGDDKQYIKWQERWSGKFERSISIPKEPKVLEDDIKASVNNGVLRISVPKEETKKSKPEKKKIKVDLEDVEDSGN